MKPGTYSQLYIHMVFAVRNRDAILDEDIRKRIFPYMSSILTELQHKSIIVNGAIDHVHLLIGLNPSVSISDTVFAVKRNTTLFINKERLCKGQFAWQEGYGAFSYSRSQLEIVYEYISNQEEHHRKKTFREEYISFLKKFAVEYDERFLFDFLEDV